MIISVSMVFMLISIEIYSNPLSNDIKHETPLQAVINEFDRQLQKDLSDDHINGSISAVIVKGNQIIWSKAYVPSDKAKNIAADSETIYRTGSISKSFTAFLMMQLVQDGIIDLNDPIEKYLPEIRQLDGYSDSTKITFKQLASHTSGLAREPKLKDAAKGPIEGWQDKILLSIPKTSFNSKPGVNQWGQSH